MSAQDIIKSIEDAQLREVAEFKTGDTVRVHAKVKEGNRERIQVFEGTVIKRQNGGARETFTVRKQASGVGVEKTWPVHSPIIEKIEVVRRGKVRRAKLVAKYAEKRAALKQIVRTGDPAEAFEAAQKLQELPKNSNPIRMHNRCKLTGRPKGYIRQFGISRIQFREMASNGLIPGIKKASW